MVKTAGVPIIFISTDMTLTAEQIIELYSSRFSSDSPAVGGPTIEIAIRDLKQHFGMGDYQCTTTGSILRFVRLSCVSLCLWRFLKMFVIKRILFPNSASEAELDKVEKEYESIFRIAG